MGGTRDLCEWCAKPGGPLSVKDYATTFRLALANAEITKTVRPFHDGRHGHLTNAAAAGVSPAALQARAGHADLSTTQRYIDLAGVRFREEAEIAQARMFGSSPAPASVAAVAEEEQRHEQNHHIHHRGGND